MNPTSFTFFESALILAIVVLGGMGSTLGVVLAKCVLPFLLPDAVKLALATLLRARLYRRIPA